MRVLLRTITCAGLAAALVVPTVPAHADTGDEAPGQKAHVLAYCDTGHVSLDPAHYGADSPDWAHDERLLIALIEPLTVLDPQTLEVRPGTASSWEASDNGQTWTFHIRPDAVWEDGQPVTASNFVECWRRTLEPFTKSRWSGLFSAIQGCAAISENARLAEALGDLRRSLKQLKAQNPSGIPGDMLNEELDALGTRPFLQFVKSRAVKRMLRWDDGERYSPEMADTAMKAIKDARRKIKRAFEDALAAFGTEAGGVFARDDKTLVVRTDGVHPYLPELMARGAFCPMHPDYQRHRTKLFDRVGYFKACGPYRLFGRGPKPPPGLERDVQSLVHLKANPKYTGPNKATMPEIFCYTDQGRLEDVRLFKDKAAQWVRLTWKEYPEPGNPKKPETQERAQIEKLEGFSVFRSSRVAYLRFRCDRPPFDDKDARMALARSVDRAGVAQQFWPAAEPTLRLVPEGVAGRSDAPSASTQDNEVAKSAMKEAGLTSDTWCKLTYGQTPGHLEAADFLVDFVWNKAMGLGLSKEMVDTKALLHLRRSGRYNVMIDEVRGFANDPYTYLSGFHSRDPDGGLGWKDETLDLLLEAARNPAAAIANKASWLASVKVPAMKGPADAATTEQGLLAFRQACLAQAEQRLLSEYVVVPLVNINEAELVGAVTGITTEAGRRRPGFAGALFAGKK